VHSGYGDGSTVGLVRGKPEEVKVLEVLDATMTTVEETATALGNLKISTSAILKRAMTRATRRSGVAGIMSWLQPVIRVVLYSAMSRRRKLVFPLIYALGCEFQFFLDWSTRLLPNDQPLSVMKALPGLEEVVQQRLSKVWTTTGGREPMDARV